MPSAFNRRHAVAAFGSVSLGAVIAACGGDGDGDDPSTTVEPRRRAGSDVAELFGAESSCTLAVEQTEGPYYFDADAIRRDVREDREGTRLRLAVRVRDAESCEPLESAVVDVWHCDARGVYSGFEEGQGERFLRGTQVTNGTGSSTSACCSTCRATATATSARSRSTCARPDADRQSRRAGSPKRPNVPSSCRGSAGSSG